MYFEVRIMIHLFYTVNALATSRKLHL